MKAFTVVISPTAQGHIDKITGWWRENRPKNPTLFEDELEKATQQLAAFSNAGLPYRESVGGTIRRLLLRNSRYYVYCRVFDEHSIVQIMAVWHASRGRGPRL